MAAARKKKEPFQDELKIYEKAISTYGKANQLTMVLEETSELQKEICKILRGEGDVDHLAEEYADVEITMSQVLVMFRKQGLAKRVKEWRAKKLARLAERLKDEEKERPQ